MMRFLAVSTLVIAAVVFTPDLSAQSIPDTITFEPQDVSLEQFRLEAAARSSNPAKRNRAASFNQRNGRRLVDAPSGSPARLTFVSGPTAPLLPFVLSSDIVQGVVERSETLLSEDETALYREITFRITNVLDTAVRVSTGRVITLVDRGGALRLPTGRILQDNLAGPGVHRPLRAGSKYLLFLAYYPKLDAFQIASAWEIRGNRVLPTSGDQERQLGSLPTDTAGFLEAVRAASLVRR